MLCLWVGVGAALLRILVVIRSLWQGVTLTQVGQGWMCGDLHGSFRPPVTPLGDFVSDDTGQHRGGCGSAGDFCSRLFEAPGSIPSISKTKPGNPFSVPAGLSVPLSREKQRPREMMLPLWAFSSAGKWD